MTSCFDSLSALWGHGLKATEEESIAVASELALRLECTPLEALKFMKSCTDSHAKLSRNGPKPPVPLNIWLGEPENPVLAGGDAIASLLDEHARREQQKAETD